MPARCSGWPPLAAGVLLLGGCGFRGAYSLRPARRCRHSATTRTRSRSSSSTSSTWCRSPASASPTSPWAASRRSSSTRGLDRAGDHLGQRRRRAAGQRGGRHPAVLAAGREVRRAGRRRATRSRSGRLDDGARIPLDRTNRNVEVEELLGALSLVLNGGGLAPAADDQPRARRSPSRAGRPRSRTRSTSSTPSSVGWTSRRRRSTGPSTARTSSPPPSPTARRRSRPRSTRSARASTSSTSSATCWSSMLEGLARLGDVGTRIINQSAANTIEDLQAAAADPDPARRGRPQPRPVAGAAAHLPVPRQLPVGAELPRRRRPAGSRCSPT